MTTCRKIEGAVYTASSLPPIINVVGNATSFLSKSYGFEIDKHPVVRMNYGVEIVNPEAQGTRTDYFATYHPELLERYSNKLKIIMCVDKDKTKRLLAKCPNPDVLYYCYQLEHLFNIQASLGFRMLYMLANFDIHVNVFGFDFNKTDPHYDKKHWGPVCNHNYELEEILIKNIIHSKGWTFYS